MKEYFHHLVKIRIHKTNFVLRDKKKIVFFLYHEIYVNKGVFFSNFLKITNLIMSLDEICHVLVDILIVSFEFKSF